MIDPAVMTSIRRGNVACRYVRASSADRHLVEVVHADDLHERAEREQADAVFGLAAVEAPEPGTEPDEELRGLHAGEPRRHEVAGLVQEHRDEHADDEQEHPLVGDREPRQEGEDAETGERAVDAAADRLALGRWPVAR